MGDIINATEPDTPLVMRSIADDAHSVGSFYYAEKSLESKNIVRGGFRMFAALTIQEKLKDLCVERGLTLEELADQTGISRSALGNYETNDYKDISHHNIVILAKFYGVTADYLLGLSENKNPANAALTELHLQDETIEILKSGKLNNRLLCEMIGHENFRRLLADIEIYVDNIAGMQIQNLNAWIDVVRNELIEKHNPDKDDPHLRVLEAAHIDDHEYFSYVVHEDIDGIIRDLRTAHKHDSVSAPEVSVAEQMKKDLEEIANFKGSKLEKQLILYCKQLQIDYRKLTEEEFRWFIKILKKSKLTGNVGRGRK